MTAADITPRPTNPKLPTQTPTYRSWVAARYRCLCPKARGYMNYGGRGIRFTLRWMRYENFYEDMGERPPGCSLDRIDVNKGYFKDNCRWADDKTQGRNKRGLRYLTIDGVTKCLTEWEELHGLPYGILRQRIRIGWSLDQLFVPPRNTADRASACKTSSAVTVATAV